VEIKISDIFFDLDHTLWDFEKNSALAFAAIFEKHNIEVEINQFLAYYIPINLKYWQCYQQDRITQQELRYGRLKESFDLLQYRISDKLIEVLSDEYIHYLPQYNHLFEGTIEILEYLRTKYNLHIITNGFHETQGNKLKNANIGHYFQTITNSEMAGVKKPDPKIFEYAITLAQAKKETSIMIGDNFDADVEGALNFGIDAIFFNENNLEVNQNVKQVHNLLALKKYL
jgi:putative hydrolase of the HAD superfamily